MLNDPLRANHTEFLAICKETISSNEHDIKKLENELVQVQQSFNTNH